MSPAAETALVMAAAAVACAIPGTFLVLRGLAMTADAIGHTLLLGIVVAYAVVGDLSSPWLTVGAAATGLLTVGLVEWLQRTGRVRQDAAIGLVFPALFALGTLLTSLNFRQIHLDIDAVLLGQVENARLVRFRWQGLDVPRAAMVLGGIAIVNGLLTLLAFKELKLTTFDAGLGRALGFRPTLIHLGLVTAVSFTAVAAFDAVGPVLVVALFAIPAAAAKLVSRSLASMLGLGIAIAAVGAVIGTNTAFHLNANIAGTVTTVLGLGFFATCLLAMRFRRST